MTQVATGYAIPATPARTDRWTDIGRAAEMGVVSTGVLLLIGSPLSTAAHGMIRWFLLGAVLKLGMLQHETIAQRT